MDMTTNKKLTELFEDNMVYVNAEERLCRGVSSALVNVITEMNHRINSIEKTLRLLVSQKGSH